MLQIYQKVFHAAVYMYDTLSSRAVLRLGTCKLLRTKVECWSIDHRQHDVWTVDREVDV